MMSKMRKTIVILAFLMFVLCFSVNARRLENFSETDAYEWLLSQSVNGSYNDNIVDTAAAMLALNAAGGTVNVEKEYLLARENDNHCWPKAGCKIKDTVWALFALQKAGETSTTLTDTVGWLKKAQTPSLTGGNWWMQVDTPNTGTCTIKYTKGTSPESSKNVNVEAGVFKDCGGGTFYDLKTCLESGLLNSFASMELKVDCGGLSSAKISITYNSGTSYYLYQEVSENTATLVVKNGCFGAGYKDPTCNYDNSLNAEWILPQIGSTLSSELYLRERYEANNAIHNALLFLTTKNTMYLDQLKKLQGSDGSWGSSPLSTAYAIIALRSESSYSGLVERAVEWLKTKQKDDGSWDSNVFTTSMVLYAAFYQNAELPSCTDSLKNQGERGVDCGGPCEIEPYNDDCCSNNEKDFGEEGIDCGGTCEDCESKVCNRDGSCNEDAGEDCFNCPDDCQTCEILCSDTQKSSAAGEELADCGGYCEQLFKKQCSEICNNDGVCDLDLKDKYSYEHNEDSKRCPDDCKCGDEVCDDYERSSGECEQDCPTEVADECGDGTCGTGEDTTCPEDCETEKCDNDGECDTADGEGCTCADCAANPECTGKTGGGKMKWIIILLLLIACGGGAYFFLTGKKGKSEEQSPFGTFKPGSFGGSLLSRGPPEKPKGKGSFFAEASKPKQQASTPSYTPPARYGGSTRTSSDKADDELEKSINEAKKLIKGER